MGRYVSGIIATGIGLALLVTSPKITSYLFDLFLSMGGIHIPYLNTATVNTGIKMIFEIILIFVGIKVIISGWK